MAKRLTSPRAKARTMKTKFHDPITRGNIINAVKMGEQTAVEFLHTEIDRLESRIKQLEMGFEQMAIKRDGNLYTTPTGFTKQEP